MPAVSVAVLITLSCLSSVCPVSCSVCMYCLSLSCFWHSFSCKMLSWAVLDTSSFPFLTLLVSLSRIDMPSCCCSSFEFPQSHYTVLLSSFPFPLSCTTWCCCSLPCLFLGSFRFESFLSQFSPFVEQIKNFLPWPRAWFSNDVCQGSHRQFKPLCWRWWSSNPCLHLHYSWWWEMQLSHPS